MIPFAGELLWSNSPFGSFYSFVGILIFLLFSHLLLLDQNRRGSILRLAIFFPTLYLIADFACNRRYTLGTPFRDTLFGVLAWHSLAKAIDVGLVYTLEGKTPPRWCVPEWTNKKPTHQNGSVKQVANEKQLALWQRTPIPSRPKWAVEVDHLPVKWRLLPLPSRLVDQILWAIDIFTLRRHDTSYIFVNEMRALEWGQKRLELAGQAHEKESRSSLKQRRDPHIYPFGYSETSIIDAALQTVAVISALIYFYKLDVPATIPFYNLPMSKQLAISLNVGIMIAFGHDLVELLGFALFQGWPFYAPCTILTPYFRNVARSKTLTDMWGVRWHTFSRRDFVRLNALIPIAPNNRALSVLKSFFWSAVFHSFLFARATPTLLGVFYNRGSFGLFMGQGCLVVLENFIGPILVQTTFIKRCKSSPFLSTFLSALQSIYVYGSLIWMTRWLLADLIKINVFSQENIHSMSIKNLWRLYTGFWNGGS